MPRIQNASGILPALREHDKPYPALEESYGRLIHLVFPPPHLSGMHVLLGKTRCLCYDRVRPQEGLPVA
jgi:hypothetical protein